MVGRLSASWVALGLALSVAPISAASVDADLVLRGGTIHDGSGGEPVVGDDESFDTGWFRLDDLPAPIPASDLARIEIAVANPRDVVLDGVPR